MMRSWEELARACRFPSLDWAGRRDVWGPSGPPVRACSVLGAGFLFVTSPIRQIINPGWPFLSQNLLPPLLTFPSALCKPDHNRPDPRDINSSHHLPQHHRRAESSFVIGLAHIALHFHGSQKHELPRSWSRHRSAAPALFFSPLLRPNNHTHHHQQRIACQSSQWILALLRPTFTRTEMELPLPQPWMASKRVRCVSPTPTTFPVYGLW